MAIRAVLFDMGGTLETYKSTRQLRLNAVPGFKKCLADAGIDLPLDDAALLDVISGGIGRYHQWRMQSLQELPTAQIWRQYVFADYPLDQAGIEQVAEPLMVYYETHFYQRAMRPEVPAVLETIRRMGLKIGLISNVSSRGMVPAVLKKYGILHYFDPLVLSSEYGRRKPDPAIFHYAARLANVPTSQCAYVGDRIARDVLGARRAGYCLAIQIFHDFDHGEADDGASPDAIIHQMTELLEILKGQINYPAPASGRTRALLFDAGDILYFRPERGVKFKVFLQELSLGSEENHLEQREALRDQAYHGQITQDQYREAVLNLYGVTQPGQIERGKRILDEEDNDVCFFDGVPETLAALKRRGYLLGIITDTANPIHVKLDWFEKGGFGDVWDTIISSNEMGISKPHPEIYQAALRQLGISASQATFVGHKSSELQGARAVGMHTVAFNYDADAQADTYINKFSDLLAEPFSPGQGDKS